MTAREQPVQELIAQMLIAGDGRVRRADVIAAMPRRVGGDVDGRFKLLKETLRRMERHGVVRRIGDEVVALQPEQLPHYLQWMQ